MDVTGGQCLRAWSLGFVSSSHPTAVWIARACRGIFSACWCGPQKIHGPFEISRIRAQKVMKTPLFRNLFMAPNAHEAWAQALAIENGARLGRKACFWSKPQPIHQCVFHFFSIINFYVPYYVVHILFITFIVHVDLVHVCIILLI